jgi:hypothetical protein
MKKILFLDCDGTIRRAIANPDGFISHPFDQGAAIAANIPFKFACDWWI